MLTDWFSTLDSECSCHSDAFVKMFLLSFAVEMQNVYQNTYILIRSQGLLHQVCWGCFQSEVKSEAEGEVRDSHDICQNNVRRFNKQIPQGVSGSPTALANTVTQQPVRKLPLSAFRGHELLTPEETTRNNRTITSSIKVKVKIRLGLKYKLVTIFFTSYSCLPSHPVKSSVEI